MAESTNSTLFPTRNALPESTRQVSVGLLNQTLANLIDLISQVRVAHWNVKGPQFYSLHLLFERLYNETEENVDEVAERITALGGLAAGTIRQASKASQLPELSSDVTQGINLVNLLVSRFAEVGTQVRTAIDQAGQAGDADTADLFTQISRQLDQAVYLLESHLHVQ